MLHVAVIGETAGHSQSHLEMCNAAVHLPADCWCPPFLPLLPAIIQIDPKIAVVLFFH